MKIKLKDTKGIILKTKGKMCEEDIEIVLDEVIINKVNIVENINNVNEEHNGASNN